MDYSKLQKIISSVLISFFLFGLVFRVPFDTFYYDTQAGDTHLYSLVSILVKEDIYGGIKNNLERYAEDIEKELGNTRAVIIPTPSDATAFQIASLNEKLFYEGYDGIEKSAGFKSKLVGTVIVGDITIPIAFDGDQSEKTILPYSDFEDKQYIYNHVLGHYEKNRNNLEGVKSEIWHGVINPQMGDIHGDIDAINDFFDKDHNYYVGEGQFQSTHGIMNAHIGDEPKGNYEPYVFYFDQFREQAALSYTKYKGYESYLENKEDLTYSRYSKDLANKIQSSVSDAEKNQIKDLIKDVNPSFDMSQYSQVPDITNTSDISTRFITQNVVKKFVETLNSSKLGEFRKNVHNAGRYNGLGSKVQVDTIPYLISVLDIVGDEVLKGVNNNLEEYIDSIVTGGLARDIAVPTTIGMTKDSCNIQSYENILYGNYGPNLQTASDCSMYRGSTYNGGTLVEANRGLNIDHIEGDINQCRALDGKSWKGGSRGLWGGNSPINFHAKSISSGVLGLGAHNLNTAIRPLFDIKGSKKITDSTKIPSPLNCFNNNYIESVKSHLFFGCIAQKQIPIYGRTKKNWSCNSTNSHYSFTKTFSQNYKTLHGSILGCNAAKINLDGGLVKSYGTLGLGKGVGFAGIGCIGEETIYDYKKITSPIFHKSPTSSELGSQIKGLITPNLPIDKDRYVDFIGASGKYAKIKYPYLFRIKASLENGLTFDSQLSIIQAKLNIALNKKSQEINTIINANNPSGLSGDNLAIFKLLKKGSYPSANIDLKKYLQLKPVQSLSKSGESKSVSYYETLIFSIYWNNLTSVSQKYKFIFENYLTDEFKNSNSYSLPKHRKSYEIAYLGAPGDAQNMYVTLDPEGKGVNPYADIMNKNLSLNSDILSSGIFTSDTNGEEVFKCAPPEGVPLWKWIPAVMCWLEDMLPPKITIGGAKCSAQNLFNKRSGSEGVYNFGQKKDSEIYGYCSTDIDTNGVSDCLQDDLKGSTIHTTAQVPSASHSQSVVVFSHIEGSDKKILTHLNNVSVTFKLAKIVAPIDTLKDFNILTNAQTIFDKNSLNELSYRNARKYISFEEQTVPLINGKAQYIFTTKNKDADIYLESTFSLTDTNGETITTLVSEREKIQIRSESIHSSVYHIQSQENSQGILTPGDFTLEADEGVNVFLVDEDQNNVNTLLSTINNASSATNKMVISLSKVTKSGRFLPLSYPLNIELKYKGELLRDPFIINKGQLTNSFPIDSFSKSGEYTLNIIDKDSKSYTRKIYIKSSIPSKDETTLTLGSTILQTQGSVTTNLIVLKDRFGNTVQGDEYTLIFNTIGGKVYFLGQGEEKLSTFSTDVYDGYRAFRLYPGDNEGSSGVNVSIQKHGQEIFTKEAPVSLVETINATIDFGGKDIEVASGKQSFLLTLTDANNNTLGDFSSRVYTTINPSYGKVLSEYVQFTNGVATIEFIPSHLAGKDIPIEFNIEGLGKILKKTIDILPSKPMKIDLLLSSTKVEAKTGEPISLQVELKDRYNNLVENDNAHRFVLEINNNSSKIITSPSLVSTSNKGKGHFNLLSTSVPGTAYIKVRTVPPLEGNTFSIGKIGDPHSRVVAGVSEGTTKIQSYYFWNKESIKSKHYNALYSVLLGAEYGDVTQKDYLAGSMLFDKDNRSLAVTSLLNNPDKFSDIIKTGKNGGISRVVGGGNLSQDIEMNVEIDHKERLYIDINNKALNTYIGKMYYSLGDNIEFRSCGETVDCTTGNQSFAGMESLSDKFSISTLGGGVFMKSNDGIEIIKITKKGKFVLNPFTSLSVDSSNINSDNLHLHIHHKGENVGSIVISLVDQTQQIVRNNNLLDAKFSTNPHSVIWVLSTHMYGVRNIYDGNVSTKSLYYNDPFQNNKKLSSFYSQDAESIENFQHKGGIGWKDQNKFLLSFAAGKTMGESVQDHMSFGLINLGDPVLRLKKIQKTFNNSTTKKSFDATIGKQISTDSDIEGYRVFDYDNDKKSDILLIKNNGTLKLLENKSLPETFLDTGNLAHIVDIGGLKYIQTGDFTGDGFDDIFFINNTGKPFLLNNNIKDFVRIGLQDQFKLQGKIIQSESFDMNNDGITDIITLDDAGDINIFYGGGSNKDPQFSKLEIEKGYGISLSNTSRNDGAFVYFEGLQQQNIKDPDLYVQLIKDNLLHDTGDKTPLNTDLIDGIIYNQINYSSREPSLINTNSQQEEVINKIPTLSSPELGNTTLDTQNALTKFIQKSGKHISYTGTAPQNTTTFIKSEYSEGSGIKISKTFTDKNGGNLQSADLVEIKVIVSNIGNTTKSNIAYIDTVDQPFRLSDKKIQNTQGTHKKAPAGYAILVDNISLRSGETMNITYTAVVQPITFGNLTVGLFEKGEAGDDAWGDIIIKPDNKNCSQNVDIFRSHSAKGYSRGTSEPHCDSNKISLPGNLAKNSIDLNPKNGVPDYIDDIIASKEKQQEFAKDTLDELYVDIDGDGIPDTEDTTPHFNNTSGGGNFLSDLDKLNDDVEHISEGVDTLIEGFSCGFGGGSCFATPLNWAPLAAGQDPTLFGKPIGDGLKVGEGVPIFSAFTGLQTTCGNSPCCLPTVWPASAQAFVPGPACGSNSAGGKLGTWSPTNFVRLFATPTLTGGFGVAACYGGPAIVAGNAIPKGVSPIVPGGNCIVAAKPIMKCSNDGSEGDPESLGGGEYFGGFGIVTANCGVEGGKKSGYNTNKYLNKNFVEKYLDYKQTGIVSQELKNSYKDALNGIGGGGMSSNQPLIGVNSGGKNGDYEFSVTLDSGGNDDAQFEDVVQIQQKRVSGFPSFLMDWVTRQIEEIVTKLTDFPTLFVVLPDFGGLVDTDWGEHFSQGVPEKFKEGVEKETETKQNYDTKISKLTSQKSGLDCKGNDEIACLSLDVKIAQLTTQKNAPGAETLSGIRSVYDFLGNIPIVSIEPQQVNIDIPWIDQTSISKTLLDWRLTSKQWEQELSRNHVSQNSDVYTNMSRLQRGLDKNIEILEGYQQTPDKLAKLFNQKQVWLEQILCNVDAISSLTGNWIDDNGKRFKAWVELYVLIKAILKSWQLLVDVFEDYDAECHECKNERDDLLNYEFKLIDMVIPKIPVIQFPKWPDIILDLHNIRAGLTIFMPDFTITKRPIVLPSLPQLLLPDASLDVSLAVDLPDMPLLPEFTIPGLPDLPSLPVVELPNLPPPPTIPKIFSSLKGILKILKLVTKAMCILKQSPFVPEWRSGDQIAFLTERQGYLGNDFLDLSLPTFSFPFVDAIKVSTFVNLEFETEFATQMAQQIAEPFNAQSSNFLNQFSNAGLQDLDFSNYSPVIDLQGEVNSKGVNGNVEVGASINMFDFTKILAQGIIQVFTYINENKSEEVEGKEFLTLVQKSLADISVTQNPRITPIINVWETVSKKTYSAEDTKIKNLKNNSTQKFEAVKNILNNELNKTQNLIKNVEKETLSDDKLFLKITSPIVSHDFVEYKKTLKKYNKKFLLSAQNLITSGGDSEVTSINQSGNELLTRVTGGITRYRENKSKLLAADPSIGKPHSGGGNSCQQANTSSYRHNYKGLYVVEKNKSYRLFSYIDRLSGDELSSAIDVDNDGDMDLLYMVDGEIFLKENLDTRMPKTDISAQPLYLLPGAHSFFGKSSSFIESINSFTERFSSTHSINFTFDAPSNRDISHFLVEYYTIVDKFLNKNNPNSIPKNIERHVVDAFVTQTQAKVTKEEGNITTTHPSYIEYIGSVPGVILNTNEMVNIRNDIINNNNVILTQGKSIYASNKTTRITYITSTSQEPHFKIIKKHTSVQFSQNITITGLTGNAYIKGNDIVKLKGFNEINTYKGLPLFGGTYMTIIPDFKDQYNETSFIKINHTSGVTRRLNFVEIDSYEIYDLGIHSSEYLMTLDEPNDYYYAKIKAIHNGIEGTLSAQTLASPQLESDLIAPELNVNTTIRIPVYLKKTIDLSQYIYDNIGISDIQSVAIDLDLELDSNNDGDPKNDIASQGIKIIQNPATIKIEFGSFDVPVNKKIGIILTDKNDNISYTEVDFEVYAPIPQIIKQRGAIIEGSLEEKLEGEPVNIYRYRGGAISQITNATGGIKSITQGEGEYSHKTITNSSGLLLSFGEGKVASINEHTGKITKINALSQIEVSTNQFDFPQIKLLDGSGNQVYEQSIKLLENREIIQVDNFDNIEHQGLYFNMESTKYAYYPFPTAVAYNPGVGIIYISDDTTKQSLLTLHPDGRIQVKSGYSLQYSTLGNHIGIEFISPSGTKIGTLLYVIEASYIMK